MKYIERQREIIPPWSISFEEEMICRAKKKMDFKDGLEIGSSDDGHILGADVSCGTTT